MKKNRLSVFYEPDGRAVDFMHTTQWGNYQAEDVTAPPYQWGTNYHKVDQYKPSIWEKLRLMWWGFKFGLKYKNNPVDIAECAPYQHLKPYDLKLHGGTN